MCIFDVRTCHVYISVIFKVVACVGYSQTWCGSSQEVFSGELHD